MKTLFCEEPEHPFGIRTECDPPYPEETYEEGGRAFECDYRVQRRPALKQDHG